MSRLLISTLMFFLLAPAPFPRHPPRAPVIRVGFLFRSWNYRMRVYKIEGKRIWFEGYPHGSRDWYGGNVMSVTTPLRERDGFSEDA